MEDKNDPKVISRHLSWRWRRGCDRVEQHRLFLNICVPVCMCVYLLNECVCLCVCARVWACLFCLFILFVYIYVQWVFLTLPPLIVQYEECQWVDCCRPCPRPGIPGVCWDSLQCPELPTKHGSVSLRGFYEWHDPEWGFRSPHHSRAQFLEWCAQQKEVFRWPGGKPSEEG